LKTLISKFERPSLAWALGGRALWHRSGGSSTQHQPSVRLRRARAAHPLALHSPSRLISPDLPRNGGAHQARKGAEKSKHAYIRGWVNHFENEAAQHVPGDGSQAGHNNAL